MTRLSLNSAPQGITGWLRSVPRLGESSSPIPLANKLSAILVALVLVFAMTPISAGATEATRADTTNSENIPLSFAGRDSNGLHCPNNNTTAADTAFPSGADVQSTNSSALRSLSEKNISVAQVSMNGQCVAVAADGSVWAWGLVLRGEYFGCINNPVKIMDGVSSVATGDRITAAIKFDGSLWIWGEYWFGPQQSGVLYADPPMKIMDNVASVVVDEGLFAAIKSDGSLWTGGEDSNTGQGTNVPTKVMEDVVSVDIGAGDNNGSIFAAIKSDGSLWTWGRSCCNPVLIMDEAASVVASDRHLIVTKSDKSLWSFTGNLWDLENVDAEERYERLEKIMDDVAFVSTSVGNGTAVVKSDGTLWMWGDNSDGQLGDGTTEYRDTPVKIMDGVRSISYIDGWNTAAVKFDDSLWIWGNNWNGQIGNGVDEGLQLTPLKIMDDVKSVELGIDVTAAIKTDGSLWTWGDLQATAEPNTHTLYKPLKAVFGAEYPSEPEPPQDQVQTSEIVDLFKEMNNLGSASLTGPSVNILGDDVTLFAAEMSVDLSGISDSLEMTVDPDNNTVSVTMGLGERDGANTNAKRENFNLAKSFVSECRRRGDSVAKTLRDYAGIKKKMATRNIDLLFDGDAGVVGYATFQFDDDGHIVGLLEGGMVAAAEARVATRAPLYGVVYAEFSLGGKAEGNLSLSLENEVGIFEGNVGVSAMPGIALGANAIVADVKGGLEGEIGGNVHFPSRSFRDAVSLYLTGRLYISGDTIVPGVSFNESWSFPQLELYPNLGSVQSRDATLAYEMPQVEMCSEFNAAQSNTMLREKTMGTSTLCTVYEGARPALATLSDGRTICTYLDTVSTGSVRLMYRVLDHGVWSEPQIVGKESALSLAVDGPLATRSDASGRQTDTAGVLTIAADGTPWVVYESSARPIEEGMGSAEVAALMELRAARFDASSGTFEESFLVASSGFWKYDYSIGQAENGVPCVVWAENTANDILLKQGGTRILSADLTGNGTIEAKELLTSDDPITEVCALGSSVAYVRSGVLYVNQALLDTADLGQTVDGLYSDENRLFFRCDGKLCCYDQDGAVEMLGASCTTSYIVHDEYVLWVQQDGFYSEVRRSALDGSEAAALTADQAYVGSFAIANGFEGAQNLVYTCQEVDPDALQANEDPFGGTVLKWQNDLARNSLRIIDVSHNAMDFSPGRKHSVFVTVANTGTEPLETVIVKSKTKDGTVVGRGEVISWIEPGASAEVEVIVTVSTKSAELSFEAYADGATFEPSDIKLDVEAEQDIALEVENDRTIFITNMSDEMVSNVKLQIYDGKEDGRLIRAVNVGSLAADLSSAVALTESDWESATLNATTSAKVLYCKAEHGGAEFSLADNSVAVISLFDDDNAGDDEGADLTPPQPPRPSNPSVSRPATPTKPSVPSRVSLVNSKITVKSKVYNGKTQKCAVPTVKVGGKALRYKTDFTYSCKAGKKIGSYKVTVKGAGKYAGTKTATFKIVPKGTSIAKLSKAKKAFTVKWKKPSKANLKQTTGYQVRWSTSKRFTKKTTKTKTVKTTSKAGKTCQLKVTKLKAKKKYYVQVRTYKKVGGKTYCSSWSKAKAVKTKR